MIQDRIPFNKPCCEGRELEYVTRAIQNGHISGDGEFTLKCQALLENELDTAKAFLTTSGTHALEMAALLLNIEPGDEVIVPSFTFVSTVNAFVMRGGRPVFADIRPDTLNIDERQLEGLITPNVRAVVPVHYAGVGCEMDTILQIADRYGIAVVEDNAHGFLGKYNGRGLGTMGCMSALSFHETKNFTCGEGGALVINDPQYIERAEIIREKGTNRSRLFRGEVNKYTWLDHGSSYLPSDMLAAFLCAQLELKNRIQLRRRKLWEYYSKHLDEWALGYNVILPAVPSHCEQPYHMFYMIMPSGDDRDELISHLSRKGVHAVFHYLPLHLSDMAARLGDRKPKCPVTEDISGRLIRLPFYNRLTESEQERVVDAVTSFYR